MTKQKIKGDYLVVSNLQNTANTPGFMDALMAFQYGEAKESNAGFEEMRRIASGGQLEQTVENHLPKKSQ